MRRSLRCSPNGVAEEVQVAGLWHACYGTDGYAQALLSLGFHHPDWAQPAIELFGLAG